MSGPKELVVSSAVFSSKLILSWSLSHPIFCLRAVIKHPNLRRSHLSRQMKKLFNALVLSLSVIAYVPSASCNHARQDSIWKLKTSVAFQWRHWYGVTFLPDSEVLWFQGYSPLLKCLRYKSRARIVFVCLASVNVDISFGYSQNSVSSDYLWKNSGFLGSHVFSSLHKNSDIFSPSNFCRVIIWGSCWQFDNFNNADRQFLNDFVIAVSSLSLNFFW